MLTFLFIVFSLIAASAIAFFVLTSLGVIAFVVTLVLFCLGLVFILPLIGGVVLFSLLFSNTGLLLLAVLFTILLLKIFSPRHNP